MKKFYFLAVPLLAVFLFALVSWSQTNEGRILGTVRDSSGGVIIGAKVTLTNKDKQVSRELVTNSTGEYVAPDLEPGPYMVSAEAPGFKKAVSSVVRVELTNDIRIDLKLQPGAITDTVVVNEEAAVLVETDSRRILQHFEPS